MKESFITKRLLLLLCCCFTLMAGCTKPVVIPDIVKVVDAPGYKKADLYLSLKDCVATNWSTHNVAPAKVDPDLGTIIFDDIFQGQHLGLTTYSFGSITIKLEVKDERFRFTAYNIGEMIGQYNTADTRSRTSYFRSESAGTKAKEIIDQYPYLFRTCLKERKAKDNW